MYFCINENLILFVCVSCIMFEFSISNYSNNHCSAVDSSKCTTAFYSNLTLKVKGHVRERHDAQRSGVTSTGVMETWVTSTGLSWQDKSPVGQGQRRPTPSKPSKLNTASTQIPSDELGWPGVKTAHPLPGPKSLVTSPVG